MKNTGVFWGVFFIFLGILFLIWNLEGWTFELDYMILYWPVLLIIWGLSYLKLPFAVKLILAGIAGLFAALIVMTLIVWLLAYIGVAGPGQAGSVIFNQLNLLIV